MATEESVSRRVGENPLPAKRAGKLGLCSAFVGDDERGIYPCYGIRPEGIEPRGDFEGGVSCLGAAQLQQFHARGRSFEETDACRLAAAPGQVDARDQHRLSVSPAPGRR